MNLNQITLPAFDIEKSASFYEAMGFRKIVSNDEYARFECSEGDATFSVEKVDALTTAPGAIVYFEVSDVPTTYSNLVEKGFVFETEPREEAWLWTEVRIKDPSGNMICIYSAGNNRKFPPWRINA